MTILRLCFAGVIKKADHRQAGDKAIVEVSICKKNRTKQGDPEAFTWVRATIWEPADFQIPKLVKGAFIAGSGDMTARSYEGKEGKAFSIDVRCTSFDVELSDGAPGERVGAPAPRDVQRPLKPDHAKAAASDDSEPPF